jgi:integrase
MTKQAMHFRAHFLPRWERLSDLTTQAIDAYPAARAREKTQRKKAPTTVTIYKEMVTLSRFLRWCARQGYIDAVPPFERVRPVSDHKPVDLTREEMDRLLPELPTRHTHPKRKPVRERYTVQWAQGIRDGDVATLRWADVDLKRGLLTIRQSNDKARVGRVLELAKPARDVLDDLAKLRPLPSSLVFGRADYRNSLNAACTRAGVERITTHGFRHSRLSELGASTRDAAAIQFIAGHKHMATTDKYVRSRTTRTGAAYAAADSGVRSGVPRRKQPKKRGARKR